MQSNKCKMCGGETEFRRIGSVQGLFCKTCDWNLVTSYIPEIELDETLYEVKVNNGDIHNINHVKIIAEVSGLNFLSSRKLLSEQNPTIFRGMALNVIRVRTALAQEGLDYEITPEFNY